jgi:hypothetical protein
LTQVIPLTACTLVDPRTRFVDLLKFFFQSGLPIESRHGVIVELTTSNAMTAGSSTKLPSDGSAIVS